MANNIVTTNQQLDQIVVYSNNWATSNIYASTNGPVAVAIDSKGNIWAAGNGRASGLPDYVTKHPVGNFSNITNYACQENLNAICIDADDNVWATSSEGYLVLDASNSYAMTEYTIGLCRGVCVNQDNVIFVTLTNSDEVRSNPFISGIDSPGIDPKGICCDQNNDIWVANTGNDGGKYYVTRLDSSNGYSATKFEVDTPPQAVAVDKNNNIWASGASKIYKLDASNSYAVTSYAAIPISGGSDLCVDDNNNIWISYYGEDKVSKFDASNFYARTDYDGETGGNFIDSGIAAHYLYQDIDVSSEGYTSSSSTSSSSSSSKSSSSSSSKSSLSSESSNVCWAIGDIGIYITDVATLSSDSSSVEFSSSSDSSISSSSSSSSSKSSSSSSSSSHSSSSSSSSSLGYSSSSSSSSSSYSSSYSSSSHSSSSSSSSSKSSSSSSSSSKSSSSYSSSSKSSSSSSSSSKSSSSSSSSSIGFSSLSSSSSSSSSSVGFTSSSDSSSVGFTSSSDSSSYEETRFRVVTTVANQTFGFTADSATDLVINWGDGTDSTINGSNSASRTYAAAGTYYVSMVGACTRFAVTTGPTLLKEILTPIVGIDGITSCFNTFRQCSALTSLPTDLFRYLTGVTTFQECFLQCSGLTSLPSGLFQYNTVCTSFRQAFYQCSNITALPADLFKYVANNCLFVQTFVACNKIVTIGSGCFDNKIGGDSGWYQCFQNCSALTTIPANLFQHVTSTNNYMFLQTFINCTSLVSIPATLFSGSGGAYQAFYGTFQGCTKLASIPSGLFDTATSASTQAFNNTFSGCTLLESVPSNLFVNNTSCTGWNSCFYNCRKLTMVSDLFYDQADRDTRFAGKTVDFTNFFRLTAASTALSAGTAPDLWNASGTLTGTTAFTGHTTSSLDNYNDIPTAWGGA